jgi:pimeloyl-ACP methyl ester carboxylesterase
MGAEADLYGSGTKGLILIHGGGRTKESWSRQVPSLVNAGFVVLAINFRGDTVDQEGRTISVGSDEENAADVRAAAAYLHARGLRSVSAVGASMGGAALADADSQSKSGEFDRIVLLASAAGKPATLKGRKLFILARDDARESGPPPAGDPEFLQESASAQGVCASGRLRARPIPFRHRSGAPVDARDRSLPHPTVALGSLPSGREFVPEDGVPAHENRDQRTGDAHEKHHLNNTHDRDQNKVGHPRFVPRIRESYVVPLNECGPPRGRSKAGHLLGRLPIHLVGPPGLEPGTNGL